LLLFWVATTAEATNLKQAIILLATRQDQDPVLLRPQIRQSLAQFFFREFPMVHLQVVVDFHRRFLPKAVTF
jgi:hypothetical protein